MFERELMILGLRRQRNLLETLIQRLENNAIAGENGERLTEEAGQVARNLRRLRRIKQDYRSQFEAIANLD